jgi:hypothetical protein
MFLLQTIHENSCHALIETRWHAADRLTDERDGHQDLAGRHVVARVPARPGSGEKCAQRRFEPIQEALREVVVGRVPGVQRIGESAFGADEVGEPPDPAGERLPGAERAAELLGGLDALVDLVL